MKITLKELKQIISECISEELQETGERDYRWRLAQAFTDIEPILNQFPPDKQTEVDAIRRAVKDLTKPTTAQQVFPSNPTASKPSAKHVGMWKWVDDPENPGKRVLQDTVTGRIVRENKRPKKGK